LKAELKNFVTWEFIKNKFPELKTT